MAPGHPWFCNEVTNWLQKEREKDGGATELGDGCDNNFWELRGVLQKDALTTLYNGMCHSQGLLLFQLTRPQEWDTGQSWCKHVVRLLHPVDHQIIDIGCGGWNAVVNGSELDWSLMVSGFSESELWRLYVDICLSSRTFVDGPVSWWQFLSNLYAKHANNSWLNLPFYGRWDDCKIFVLSIS